MIIMSNTHFYSKKEATKIHNQIVDIIGGELIKNGHSVNFPDTDDDNSRQPDISVDNKLVIEIKVLNPTIEDYKVDQKAIKDWEETKFVTFGGTINSKPIEQDFKDAVEQFSDRDEEYRLVVLVSPLEWQLSYRKLKSILKGTITISIGLTSRKIVGQKRTNVPIKREISNNINGVLYLYGSSFSKRKLWLLNENACSIFSELCEEICNLWEKK